MIPGIGLALFGTLIMLVAPLHRVTTHRRFIRGHIAAPLDKAYPMPEDEPFTDLLKLVP